MTPEACLSLPGGSVGWIGSFRQKWTPPCLIPRGSIRSESDSDWLHYAVWLELEEEFRILWENLKWVDK